ncbi:hypothetical protein [Raineyella fluvialis]|uniref:Uncharacterized protein n=1 Tax=Raineyella fluvialis TaxID=2662261 RepID=A0A5Q2F982_9ACTN|nr:hypothetical protein [Raineyella fluvialis]QGF23379.1 hypothetical protein Rai3103_06560 [Raineyella fluvialis]
MSSTVHVDLSGVERALDRMSSQLSSQIDQVDASVGVVRSDLHLTTTELRELREEFEEYVRTAQRTASVQQSETRVVNLKAELDRQFGHYGVVRRTSVGLLQAFDVGNVSNDAVKQVSEELMVQTPRYWLAPVIVALAAWSRDNKEVAEKSVQEAYNRDPRKTSLFFTLVLRRQGRMDGANRWLKHYLASLDPSSPGREFAVVLEATSYNAFGPAAQVLLTEQLTTWRADLRHNQETVEAQIRTWAGELGRQREQLTDESYPTLRKISPEWDRLQWMLEQSSALPVTIDTYQAIATSDGTIPTVLEGMLDDILDGLVTEYDAEELPLRRDVIYHESVIEEQGDLDRARERTDLMLKATDESIDIVSLQTMAAITPELVGVSTQTQRIAIGVGQSDFRTAVGRYCAVYRGRAVASLSLVLDGQHSNYAATYGFGGVTLSTDTPEATGIMTIRSAWESALTSYIERVSFKNSWYTRPVLIAAAIALVVAFINPVAGLVAALVGGGIVYFLGEKAKEKCRAAVADVERIRETAIGVSVDLYRDATAEFVDAMETYSALDSQEGDLLRLIDTWPTATNEIQES